MYGQFIPDGNHVLWLDLETYCEEPITNGTHKYAESVEVMLFAYAINSGPVAVWDVTTGKKMPAELYEALEDKRYTIVAHNSHFDRTVLRHASPGLVAGDVSRWRDTMILALLHSLPGALEKLCDIFKLTAGQAKDKDGKSLINLFCKPRPKTSKLRRATAETHPDEWARFIKYAAKDIESMRALVTLLPKWNYTEKEHRLWCLDQKINDRGFLADVELAHAALAAVDSEQKRLASRTQQLTYNEVSSATKRDALLRHIVESYNVPLPNMQKATLEKARGDESLPAIVRELIDIRLQASMTSTSKYKTLLRSVSSDGRLRGTTQFCGANRTRRWSGRLFQPQNMSRPTLKQNIITLGINSIKDGTADLIFGNIMELVSSATRGCIVSPAGRKLVVSDLSNIEGRFAAWIAGEEWKLEAFRDFDAGIGSDLYIRAYAQTFNIEPSQVTKAQRQIGKVMELALGYSGGVGAFLTFALVYGLDLEELADAALPELAPHLIAEARRSWDWAKKKKRTFGLTERQYIACDALKRAWREAHPAIAGFWKELDLAIRHAYHRPGEVFTAGRLKVRRKGSWLRIMLPSGQSLSYPGIHIDEKGQISYMGMNTYTRKWCRIKSYSGKFFENVCQSGSRDVLAENMPHIEDSGYLINITVHDEVICDAANNDMFNVDDLSRLLATVPAWAEGLPLAAGGFEDFRYRKD